MESLVPASCHPNVNCLGFALNLGNDISYCYVATDAAHHRFVGLHTGTEFVDWIVPRLVEAYQPEIGSLVMYSDIGGWVHAGVIAEVSMDTSVPIVRSRWGITGIYQHPIFAIPTYYGDRARFYRQPAHALSEFLSYVKAQGWRRSA